jgi:uridylate kinase
MKKPAYKRILLKLGGESLSGEKGYGIDTNHSQEKKVMVLIYKRLILSLKKFQK